MAVAQVSVLGHHHFSSSTFSGRELVSQVLYRLDGLVSPSKKCQITENDLERLPQPDFSPL